VSFARINSASKQQQRCTMFVKTLSRSKVKVACANFCKFSSWLTTLANKPTKDDLLNLTRDECEHGTHLFFFSLSLCLFCTIFFLISYSAIETSFYHLSYISHVYLSANNKRGIFLAFT